MSSFPSKSLPITPTKAYDTVEIGEQDVQHLKSLGDLCAGIDLLLTEVSVVRTEEESSGGSEIADVWPGALEGDSNKSPVSIMAIHQHGCEDGLENLKKVNKKPPREVH